MDQLQQAPFGPAKSFSGGRIPRTAVALACLLAGMVPTTPAIGQDAPPAYVPQKDPAEEYLEAVERIEADRGPYDMELSDLYLGLGQKLIDAGEYEKARDAFHRGVLVQRVNLGPNSPEQTNHLYMLANIESALGEFEAADKAINNIYHINSKHYGEDSAEMLPVLKRMFEWYNVTRPIKSEFVAFPDLLRNIELTAEIVRISEETYGERHPNVATAYRRLGEANFRAIMYLMDEEMFPDMDRYRPVSLDAMNGSDPESFTMGEFYRDGRLAFRLFQETIEADPSTTLVEYADSLAIMGDWFLLIEKYRHARNFYEAGYQVLAAVENQPELAEEFMKEPQPMPIFADPLPDTKGNEDSEFQVRSVDVSMTVTSLGNLRQIEFPNASEELSKDELKRIRRELLKIPFRPAMKDGEVVTTKEFNWRYRVVPGFEAS